MGTPDFDAWVDRARDQDILSVAIGLGAALRRVGHEHVGPCPSCGGRDRFGVNPAKGVFVCRGAGGGDVVGMAMHVASMSFTQACEYLTGEPPPNGRSAPLTREQIQEREAQRRQRDAAQRQREAEEARRREKRAQTASEIWSQCVPIAGTLAETYLHQRGIPTPLVSPWPDCFGFHGNLRHEIDGRAFPCLVSRVDDVGGHLAAVWRIYLGSDGRKADVANPKLGLGPAAGGAVRIGGLGPKIAIAEGVETALAVWWLNNMKIPCWSALSTSGVSGVELPLGIERVSCYPDGDDLIKKQGDEYVPEPLPPGLRAAHSLRDRLAGTGIKCVIAEVPISGLDYLDVWNSTKERAA